MSTGHQGQVLGKNPGSNLRTAYGESVVFQLDMSPIGGGYTFVQQAAAGPASYLLNNLGNPSYVAPNTAGQPWEGNKPLDRILENITDTPGVIATATGLSVRYYRTNAGALITMALYQMPKGGGQATALQTWTQAADFTIATGTWTTFTDTFSDALDVEDNVYWLYIVIDDGGGLNNVRLADVLLDITKIAAE
jgi:hypothetical protein